MDGKNKDINKFIAAVQTKSFKKEYLGKKDLINAQFERIISSNDMPNDHTYGCKANDPDIIFDQIMKFKFASDVKPERLLNVEKIYKPQFLKNRLKPPKPTVTSKLRHDRTHAQTF